MNQQIEIIGKKLLTPQAVAESGLMSLVKQWSLRKSGELEFLRVGKRIFYEEDFIERFLHNSQANNNDETNRKEFGG